MIESAIAAPARLGSRSFRRVDPSAIGIWALTGGLVLYLGLDGGGYDVIVRSQIGIVVWWVVLIGAAWTILPVARLSRVAWIAVALLAAFVIWTAIVSTSSLSSERSLQELSRVVSYLGVLLLALMLHRDRATAVRQTVTAVGAAIAVIAVLAVISRLFPDALPAAHVTGTYLPSARSRLSWPLNYWNGLAALAALGLPLLLSIATAARTLQAQAAAAAAVPVLALCAYLTASRGGAIVIGIATLVFLALASDRLAKLATMLIAAAGSTILIVGAAHRDAIQHGLTGHAAVVQGRQLFVTLVLVSAGVAIGQIGVGLAARHGTLPRLLRVPRRTAAALTAGAVLVAVVAALAASVPSRLSHAWHDFKSPAVATTGSDLVSRLSTLNGNGRYQYWQVAVRATSGKRLTGSGPATFQLLWLPRATQAGGYVSNAHSLYVETLAEVGVVGLILLAAFLVAALGAALRLVTTSEDEARTHAAGTAAAMVAFLASALVEWIWQLPVVPVAFLVLAAAVLAPAAPKLRASAIAGSAELGGTEVERPAARLPLRLGLMVSALAALTAIAFPLATATDVRQSQQAVNAGMTQLALRDARSAARVEPGAASPQLQQALVLELQRQYPAALLAARNATRDEPQNWTGWLTLSRLEAESGQVNAAISAYRRARSLNPLSPLFQR